MLRVTRANPHVTYRYTVAPSELPPNSVLIPISSSVDDIKKEINLGYKDALNIIKSKQVEQMS
jgi:hypothetical protein